MTTDIVIGIIYAHIAHHLSNSLRIPEPDKYNKWLEYPQFILKIDPMDYMDVGDLRNINNALILTQLCSEEPTITLDGYTLIFCPMINKSFYEDLK